jgi:hypothetical protein
VDVREVDLPEARELDVARQLGLDERRELALGHVPALKRVERVLTMLLGRLLQRHTEDSRIGADALVPAGERLPQGVREDAPEVGYDGADAAHAAIGAGSRTVSS